MRKQKRGTLTPSCRHNCGSESVGNIADGAREQAEPHYRRRERNQTPPIRIIQDSQKSRDSLGILGISVSINPCGAIFMKLAQCALAAAALFVATGASAQSINLTGAYRCVEKC